MYPNFNAEYARKNFTLEKFVEELKKRGVSMTVSTLSLKKTGKFPITLDEAKVFKEIVETNLPLDELFEEAS